MNRQTDLIDPTLREVARLGRDARNDIEAILDVALDNVRHYQLLARVDALSADIGKFVLDTLAERGR